MRDFKLLKAIFLLQSALLFLSIFKGWFCKNIFSTLHLKIKIEVCFIATKSQ